ncbi:conjugative transfer protein TraD [Hephaestia caeni]|uniref:Conjugative transfer protein TraD n=1 Tax=Hephaestia caeni TaxID=645617 RepID=A0A397P802_9SPHN|nr:conjugal transfer protein TraD [Hephaestia caeni]RIA45686.1 conjugative transfer protein TraD [Hephaestia caeni]
MRKPRDFDSELKMLADKAKLLKERRVRQLGELVIATGADALDADMLAGALLGAAANKDASAKEAWRKAGVAFFQRSARKSAPRSGRDDEGTAPRDGDAVSA